MHRRGELARIAPGAYLDPADPRLQRPEDRHLLQVVAAVPRMAPDAVVSHQSAAVLHRLPVWHLPLARVHATRPRRSGALRTGRLHVHTAPLEPTRSSSSTGSRSPRLRRTVDRHCAHCRLRGGRRRARRGAAPPPRHPGRARRRPRPDGGLARRSQGATGGRIRRPATDERRGIAEPGRDGPVRRRTAGAAMDSGRAGRRRARHRRLRMARPRRCRGVRRLRQVRQAAARPVRCPPTSSLPRSGGRTGCGRCCAASSVGCGRTWTTSPRWRSGCRDDPHKRCRARTGVATPVRARQRLCGCLRAPRTAG